MLFQHPGQCQADWNKIKAKRVSDITYSKIEEGVPICASLWKSPHLLEIRESRQPSGPNTTDTLIPFFTSHKAYFSMYLADNLLFDCFSIFEFEAEPSRYDSFLKTALTGLWNSHFTKINKLKQSRSISLTCLLFVVLFLKRWLKGKIHNLILTLIGSKWGKPEFWKCGSWKQWMAQMER